MTHALRTSSATLVGASVMAISTVPAALLYRELPVGPPIYAPEMSSLHEAVTVGEYWRHGDRIVRSNALMPADSISGDIMVDAEVVDTSWSSERNSEFLELAMWPVPDRYAPSLKTIADSTFTSRGNQEKILQIAEHAHRIQESYAHLASSLPDADTYLLEDAAIFHDAIRNIAWQPEIWTDEGEVAFEWKKSEKHAVVSFDGDGGYGYALKVGGRFKAGETANPLPDSLPTDLLEYIKFA